jgi:pseudouridine-5'-phosphate glycosidase/pseudouridine kinase
MAAFDRNLVVLSNEVAAALKNGAPVVALESTIISHGMPFPANVETARSVEAICRERGVTPATIAILHGRVHVGLSDEELLLLGQLPEEEVRKCSRRDIAYVCARKGHGATTVAATMLVAAMVGIEVFVTGGIGGVHRGVQQTMDISADLSELGRTRVAVVCAGVKSILDIPRTLEFLETQGVPVYAYGQDKFPAFFTPDSGMEAPFRSDSTEELAAVMHATGRLGISTGMVIGVPVPNEHAADRKVVTTATEQALREARERGITGKRVTPFLLQRINELTGGHSLQANVALIKNNARVGADMALALSSLSPSSSSPVSSCPISSSSASEFPVVVIGGVNRDVLGSPLAETKLLYHTSNRGTVVKVWGGVGRNIAEALARLQVPLELVTTVGDDEEGKNFREHCNESGISTPHLIVSKDHPTNTYMAIFDEQGHLVTTVAAMDASETLQPAAMDVAFRSRHQVPSIVVVDGNLSQVVISHVFCKLLGSAHMGRERKQQPALTWFEPTSIVKSVRGLPAWRAGAVHVVSPSQEELIAMAEGVGFPTSEVAERSNQHQKLDTTRFEVLSAAILDAVAMKRGHNYHVVAKHGAQGLVLSSREWHPRSGKHVHRTTFLPVVRQTIQVNSSGAGDCLVGGTCFALHHLLSASAQRVADCKHEQMKHALMVGMAVAEITVESVCSVSPEITPKNVMERVQRSQGMEMLSTDMQALRAALDNSTMGRTRSKL